MGSFRYTYIHIHIRSTLINHSYISSDPKCQRENGYFDVEGDCTNYYNCDNGVPYVFPCAQTLVFDVGAGTCVRVQDKSPAAQNCTVVKEEAAFICPKGTAVGPQGLVQAHPIYPHPEDCQYYYNCIDDGVSEEKVNGVCRKRDFLRAFKCGASL